MRYHKSCINRKSILIDKYTINGGVLDLKKSAIDYILDETNNAKYRLAVAWHQWLIVNQINHFNKTLLTEALENSIKRAIYTMPYMDSTTNEMYNLLKTLMAKNVYQTELPPNQYSELLKLLTLGETSYTMSRSTYEPITLFRFRPTDKTTIIPDVTILQTTFNGNALEFWEGMTSGDYRNVDAVKSSHSDWTLFMAGFHMGMLTPMEVVMAIGSLTPGSDTYGDLLFSFCRSFTTLKPNYYIATLELNKRYLTSSFRRVMELFRRISHLDVSDEVIDNALRHISIEDNSDKNNLGVLDDVKLSTEGWLPSEKVLLEKIIFSLEADGEESDTTDDTESDDTDDGADDSMDDSTDEDSTDDEAVDDSDGDGGDDSGEDSAEEDDGSDDDDTDTTDDADPNSDDDSDTEEEEPEKDNTPNTSDIKGVMVEIAEKETLDSAMFRIELANQIQSRLEDGTLNNIQLLILKKLKTYWLNYWSIQSVLDTLELVRKMG